MGVGRIGQHQNQNQVFNFNKMMEQINGASTPKTGKQTKNALFAGNFYDTKKDNRQMFMTLSGAKGPATAAKVEIGFNSTLSGKKDTGYRHGSFTSRLKQARKPQNIRAIATEIRAQIADLKAKQATGEYDEEDILAAIAHAEALAAAADERANNLEKEELAERKLERKELEEQLFGEEDEEDSVLLPIEDNTVLNEAQKRMEREIEKEMQKLLEQMQQEMTEELSEDMEKMTEELSGENPLDALDEMADVLSGNLSKEDIEEMKKKHRASEDMMIARADMDYLKAKFSQLQRQKEAVKSGAAFSLAGQQMNAKQLSAATKSLKTAASKTATGQSHAHAPIRTGSGGFTRASFSAPDSFANASVSVGASMDIST